MNHTGDTPTAEDLNSQAVRRAAIVAARAEARQVIAIAAAIVESAWRHPRPGALALDLARRADELVRLNPEEWT